MKQARFDLARVLRAIEDRLVPRLRLSLMQRVVYYHLLRHTRLQGRTRLRCSIPWLATGTGVSPSAMRRAVRSLAEKRAVCILSRGEHGHVLSLRLPTEIPECQKQPERASFDFEAADFLQQARLRNAIHRREGGRCFYCRRQLAGRSRALDHVFPRAQWTRDHRGRRNVNSYRNLVSCYADCNTQKGRRPASDFLRALYRSGQLNAAELADRLMALKALSRGRLKPVFTP